MHAQGMSAAPAVMLDLIGRLQSDTRDPLSDPAAMLRSKSAHRAYRHALRSRCSTYIALGPCKVS